MYNKRNRLDQTVLYKNNGGIFMKIEKLFTPEFNEKIIRLGEELFKNPELGYKEVVTRSILMDFFKENNIVGFTEHSVTGFIKTIGPSDAKYNIAIICDLDGVPTLGHKYSNKIDNAAHSCGHHEQMSVISGVFHLVNEYKLLEGTDCKLTIIGTPAEEYVDLDYRNEQIKKHKIKKSSGKQNMILDGVFDDIDVVFNVHTNGSGKNLLDINTTLNGFISKEVRFLGKSAHAGASPHLGINALNAANLGMTAVHMLRETFEDQNHIRFHPIITNGGTTVNTVPEEVILKAYVRGATTEAIMDANKRINNALTFSGKALGVEVEISDEFGYMPTRLSKELSQVVLNSMLEFVNEEDILHNQETTASGDVGDLSNIIPTVQFGYGGNEGLVHSKSFFTSDFEAAYILPMKVMLSSILKLANGEIEHVIKKFKQGMTKEEYIKNWLQE